MKATEGAPILICYDGSGDAERAVDVAAALFGPRPAVVLNVAPTMTFAESMAATSPLVPGSTFEDLNTAEALRCAKAGAARAGDAGLDAEARATIAPTVWQGIVDVAGEIHAAVIVIGSRGRDGFRENTGRSVSHNVAMHAGRPVLIVPSPPGRRVV